MDLTTFAAYEFGDMLDAGNTTTPSPSPSPSPTASAQSDVYAKDVDSSELVGTIVLNVFLGLGLLVVFEQLRRKAPDVYMPRKRQDSEYRDRTPTPSRRSFLGWVKVVRGIDHALLLRYVGLDAYVMARFIKLCYRFCVFGSVVGLLVLTPVYVTGKEGLGDVQQVTLQNVKNADDNWRLWVAVVFAYVSLVHFLHLLKEEYQVFIKLRTNFLIRGDANVAPQKRYSVLLEHIPKEHRSDEALKEYFQMLFPDQVHSAVVLHRLQDLEALVAKRDQAIDKLEHAIVYRNAKGKEPLVREGGGCRSNKVEAIPHYSKLVDDLNEKIIEMQQAFKQQAEEQDAAFVKHFAIVRRMFAVPSAVVGKGKKEERKPEADTPRASSAEVQALAAAVEKAEGPREGGGEGGAEMRQPGEGEEEEIQVLRKSDPIPIAGLAPPQPRSHVGSELGQGGTPSSAPSSFYNRFMGRFSGMRHSWGWSENVSSYESQFDPKAGLLEEEEEGKAHGPKNVLEAPVEAVAGLTREALGNAALFGNATMRVTEGITGAFGLLTVGHTGRSSTGFVTFTTKVARSMACQMLLSQRPDSFRACQAPEARDIIWKNVAKPVQQITYRSLFVNGFLLGGFFFWNSVIALIVAIGNLNELGKYLPFIKEIPQDSLVYTVLSSYLSVVLLLVVLGLLPVIFTAVAIHYEGYKTMSEVHMVVCRRYFLYQVANVYVVIVAQSFWNIVNLIPKDPENALLQFGAKLPLAASYCTQLVITKTLAGLPLELLRIGPLLQTMFLRLVKDQSLVTPRERNSGINELAVSEPEWTYPTLLLVFLLCAAYEVIAPALILPAGALYFGLAGLVYKHQALFLHMPQYESGGQFWYILFSRTLVALVCGQLLLISYLLTRSRFEHASALGPLPVLVLWFHRYTSRHFGAQSKQLSLDFAMAIDDEEERGEREWLRDFSADMYRQPSLAAPVAKPEVEKRSDGDGGHGGDEEGGVGGVGESDQAERCRFESEIARLNAESDQQQQQQQAEEAEEAAKAEAEGAQ